MRWGITVGILKFDRDKFWSFNYRQNGSSSSSERRVNHGTKMVRMSLSSTCKEQLSVGVVRFLWAKTHNPSEIHRHICGMYGEDCMGRSNVSGWCPFLKELPPWKMRSSWRCCYGPYSLPHILHICPCEFHSVMPLIPQKRNWQLKLTIEALRSRSWSRYRHVFPIRDNVNIILLHVYYLTFICKTTLLP